MTSQPASLPVLQDVSFGFGTRQVLRHACLDLRSSSINCLLGASGCGKSTLLRVVAGLLQPRAGHVLVSPAHCAMVFQDARLLRWLTVAENLGLALAEQPRSIRTERIQQALEQVQLAGTQNLLPRELSGGMAQRVGIARALLRKPRLLLMDEPFAALDAITRHELQRVLRELIAVQQTTCLFVTHDVNEALTLGHRLFVMRDGHIFQQWDNAPDVPRNEELVKQQILQALHAANPSHPPFPNCAPDSLATSSTTSSTTSATSTSQTP